MPVTIYRSSDAGAPVVLPTGTSVSSILNACLVTGYGEKPAAGWTRPFTSGNLSVFKQPAGTSGFHLRVDEGTARVAYFRGYETMTAVSTGTRLFPTTAQEANPGIMLPKGTADSTALEWTLIASTGAFWLFIKPHITELAPNFTWSIPFFFGDIDSYKPGDLYKCMIAGSAFTTEGYTGANPGTSQFQYPLYSSALTSVYQGTALSRSYTGAIGAALAGLHTDMSRCKQIMNDGGYVTFPNGSDGGIYASRIFVHELFGGVSTIRGALPGLWQLAHDATLFAEGDTYNGSGDFAGRTFEFVRVRNGIMAIETSNTW